MPHSVEEVGPEYVDEIVDCSPGQRARYKGRLRTLKAVEVRGKRGTYRPFDQRIDLITEDDVTAWLIDQPRSLKTKANYHGLLFGVFTYAADYRVMGALRGERVRSATPDASSTISAR